MTGPVIRGRAGRAPLPGGGYVVTRSRPYLSRHPKRCHLPVSPCHRAHMSPRGSAASALHQLAQSYVNENAPNLPDLQPTQLRHGDPIQIHLALIHFPEGFH